MAHVEENARHQSGHRHQLGAAGVVNCLPDTGDDAIPVAAGRAVVA